MERGKWTRFAKDTLQGALKNNIGLFNFRVVRGFFPHHEYGHVQKTLFDALRKQNKQKRFKRTIWQVVFDGQTAGLVRRFSRDGQRRQYHVRMWRSGHITVEEEDGMFHHNHWRTPRERGKEVLEKILNGLSLSEDIKNQIRALHKTEEQEKEFDAFWYNR